MSRTRTPPLVKVVRFATLAALTGNAMNSMTRGNIPKSTAIMASSGLRGGAAEVEITPSRGESLWGFATRSGASLGTLDPLFARVLVLEADEQRVALVTLDVGRAFGPASLERLRAAVKRSSDISKLLVLASHTHSGPIITDEYAEDDHRGWETATLQKIVKAVEVARQACRAVRIGAGYGTISIGYNRRRVNQDGTVTWIGRNATHVPTSPVDPVVSVLRLDAEGGSPLAILVNYACHPVTFGPDNLQYSADFPGVTTKILREAFGNAPVCFFLQGAAGDINPFYAATPLDQDAVRLRDWEGEQLGREAVRVANAIQFPENSQASLQFAEDLLPFRLRWDPEEWPRSVINAYGSAFAESFMPRVRSIWELPVVTLLINRRIALMSMPGEPFVEFQINWRDRCPVRDAFLLAYANGYYGYFPTLRAATEGGYGATSPTTWIEVGAGERIVDHALTRVYEMLGRLRNVPDITEW